MRSAHVKKYKNEPKNFEVRVTGQTPYSYSLFITKAGTNNTILLDEKINITGDYTKLLSVAAGDSVSSKMKLDSSPYFSCKFYYNDKNVVDHTFTGFLGTTEVVSWYVMK